MAKKSSTKKKAGAKRPAAQTAAKKNAASKASKKPATAARAPTASKKAPVKSPPKTASAGPAGDAAAAGMSDESVQRATGRTWAEWGKILDDAGALEMTHKQIAVLLHEKHGVSEWWSQMVTVGYERLRGLRSKHEAAGGFQVSASKTIAAPVERAFEAWADEKIRERWLPGARMTVRKATPHKSMRITWEDGSNLEAMFYGKGPGKCQVVAQVTKLPDAVAAAERKAFWGDRLAGLRDLLERPA